MLKKLIITSLLFTLGVSVGFAQGQKYFFAGGLSAGSAVDAAGFKDILKTGFGGRLQAGVKISKTNFFTLKVNNLSFAPKEPNTARFNWLSIRPGIRANFNNSSFFVEAAPSINFYKFNKGTTTTKLGAGVAFGYNLKLDEKSSLEFAPEFDAVPRSGINSLWYGGSMVYRINF